MEQQAQVFTGPQGTLRYLLALPAQIGEKDRRWPLLLFLHGRGERGDDLELVKLYGLPARLEQVADFEFVTVSPQCPVDTEWAPHAPTLLALLDDIAARYPIDPDRVLLTGLSMGARGLWHVACAAPERFAAIVAISGRCELDDDQLAALHALPVRLFHGALDPVAPPAASRRIEAVLRAAGGDVQLTLYPEADHDAWTRAYAQPELYDWLLAQRRPGVDSAL